MAIPWDNITIPFANINVTHIHVVQNLLLHMNWSGLTLSVLTAVTHAIFRFEFPHSMPLWLALSSAFLHLGLLIGPAVGFTETASSSIPDPVCIAQGTQKLQINFSTKIYLFTCNLGAILQYSSVAVYCWMFLIAMHL